MSDGSGGKSAGVMDEEELAVILSRPIRAACAFCSWTYDGLFGDARERSRAHRQEHHPEAKAVITKRKRRMPSLAIKQPRLSDEELAEVDAERKRRAALNGVDLAT